MEDVKMKILRSSINGVLFGCLIIISFTSMAFAELPNPGMQVDGRTAIVITDPQNDFLSPKGATWGVVGKSVTENNTVENIETLLKIAKKNDIPVFVSPHYYYPTDKGWKFEGALEVLMHNISMFSRTGQLSLEGFKGSGADWLDRYKPYIEDGKTVVSSPHKVFGPENNDLALQLRKRRIDKIILAGMSANLCTESHMRELTIVPEGNGYEAALVNFRFIASAVWTTKEAGEAINKYKTTSKMMSQGN
jgi:nicotinamidase-related amidase